VVAIGPHDEMKARSVLALVIVAVIELLWLTISSVVNANPPVE
jgi:hypothetical protein